MEGQYRYVGEAAPSFDREAVQERLPSRPDEYNGYQASNPRVDSLSAPADLTELPPNRQQSRTQGEGSSRDREGGVAPPSADPVAHPYYSTYTAATPSGGLEADPRAQYYHTYSNSSYARNPSSDRAAVPPGPSRPAQASQLTPEQQAAVEYYASYYASYYNDPASKEYYTQYYTNYYLQQQGVPVTVPPPQQPDPSEPRKKGSGKQRKERNGTYTVQMDSNNAARADATAEVHPMAHGAVAEQSAREAGQMVPLESTVGTMGKSKRGKQTWPPTEPDRAPSQKVRLQRFHYDAPSPAGCLQATIGFIFGSWERGHLRPLSALLMYTFLFLATSGVQWGFRGYSDQLDSYSITQQMVKQCAGNGHCVGKEAVLRIALGNTLFFSVMFFLTLGVSRRSDLRFKIHTGFWLPKLAIWGAIIVGCFYMPSRAIEKYSLGAKIISGAWLIVMILTLLDSVYSVNRYLLTDKNNGCFRAQIAALVFLMLLSYAASVAELATSAYLYVTKRQGCGKEVAFLATTAVLALIYTLLSLLPHRYEDSGLVTAGAVFAYCGFLTFSALSSGAAQTCRRFPTPPAELDQEPTWIVIVSFILACLSIAWSAGLTAYDQMPIARGILLLFGVQNQDQREQRAFVREGGWLPGYTNSAFDNSYEYEDRDHIPYRPDVMHFLYALASCYMGMVLTSWNTRGTALKFEADRGNISMWVKMGSSWAVAFFYGWTVLVPEIMARKDPYHNFLSH